MRKCFVVETIVTAMLNSYLIHEFVGWEFVNIWNERFTEGTYSMSLENFTFRKLTSMFRRCDILEKIASLKSKKQHVNPKGNVLSGGKCMKRSHVCAKDNHA